jgi:hypothetical protein
MSTLTLRSLEEKIAALGPEVDVTLRAELQQVLRTLHDAGNPIGALLVMSRLSLRLTGTALHCHRLQAAE